MNQNRPPIDLQETSSEYLVFVPFAQKERAKAIEGRRWDGQRKCWVYPKTKRVYDELIAEFGDDVDKIRLKPPAAASSPKREPARHIQTRSPASRPKTPVTTPPAAEAPPAPQPDMSATLMNALEKQNETLQQEVRRLHEMVAATLQSRTSDGKNAEQVNSLQSQLREAQAETTQLLKQIRQLQEERAAAEDRAKAIRAELDELVKERQLRPDDFRPILREIAIDATGGDQKFQFILQRCQIDRDLPIVLAREIEAELSTLLQNGDSRANLYDLLREADDKELLPPEAISMGHVIRRQRNLVAHGQAYHKTLTARIVLCLFAAALLWPEFPEE